MRMKKLKDQVEKEDRELLSARAKDFWENTLLPQAQESAAEQKRLRRKKRPYILAATATSLVILALGTWWMWSIFASDYDVTYETKKSDVAYLNSTLTHTQLVGDYSVDVIREVRSKKPVYFVVNQQVEMPEIGARFLTIDIVVKRDYQIDQPANYADSFEFLEYTVYFNKTRTTDTSNDFTFYCYAVEAFIDTGAERFVIDYDEATVDDSYSFEEYLSTIIKQR